MNSSCLTSQYGDVPLKLDFRLDDLVFDRLLDPELASSFLNNDLPTVNRKYSLIYSDVINYTMGSSDV